MNILITGGTGLVGSHLIPKLIQKGHRVVNLTTSREKSARPFLGAQQVYWNPNTGELDSAALKGIDAVVNLAGFNVANRWTAANKENMASSRVKSTHLVMQKLQEVGVQPTVFVSAGAIGIYAPSFNVQDESAAIGQGFLANLSTAWEEASEGLPDSTRRVVLRIGVVLNAQEGAVAKMLPFFRLGLGSAVGSGKQWMSWIHVEDLASMFVFALENGGLRGIHNAVSPQPVTNAEFSKALAHALHKPFFLPPVPAFALKLLFGEMASMLLVSQKISAQKITNAGFTFAYSDLNHAFSSLFQHR